MKAKSLIRYKIRYDPDKKQKSKSAEVEEDGATLIYVIPVVSGKKGLEFMINEQISRYKELAMARAHTSPEKFHFFGQYWFDRALIGIWICFYGQADLRKGALTMISKLKWKKRCFVNMSTPP